MKFSFLFSILFIGHIAYAQSDINSHIDTSNYYHFYANSYTNLKGDNLTTNWLRLDDIVPIVIDELTKAGYDWLYDRCLFKINSSEYIVLAGYTRKSNFGFLYIEGHDAFPSATHRNNMTGFNEFGADYVSCEETTSGKPNFVRIKKLPANIFPLNENNYWFQYTNDKDDNNRLLTKESAINILRQDIKKYLSTVSKPIE